MSTASAIHYLSCSTLIIGALQLDFISPNANTADRYVIIKPHRIRASKSVHFRKHMEEAKRYVHSRTKP